MEIVKVVEVNPELAKEWLKQNTYNRKPSEKAVVRYSNDMKNGLWSFTGDSIKFNGDGTLLDGQQRLHAIIKSNTTQKFIVVYGIQKDAFMQMDSGKKRNSADVLTVLGVKKYQTDYAALTKNVYSFYNDQWESNINLKILADYFQQNPDLVASHNFVLKYDCEGILISRSMLATAHYILSKINNKEADKFIKKIITGIDITETDVCLLVRKKLENYRFHRLNIRPRHALNLFFKAWNYYRVGESPRSISLTANSKQVKPI